jgi:hypothetical protein
MLPGVDGHLLSGAFMERQLPAFAEQPDADRVRRDLIRWRAGCVALGPASTPRALLQSAAPLFAALGFEPPGQIEDAGTALGATLRSGARTVALLVTPWGETLDPLWRAAVTQAARRSASWCVLFDGLRLRIVDARRLYARRHLEFDLDLAADNPRCCAALWRTSSAASLTADRDDTGSLHALVAASDRHAAGVCRSLRDGVLAASGEVLRALIANRGGRSLGVSVANRPAERPGPFSLPARAAHPARLADPACPAHPARPAPLASPARPAQPARPDHPAPPTHPARPTPPAHPAHPARPDHPAPPALADSFEQALTIVYRLLFLLFAEARALVPLWHPVYRESYSLESLRDIAERSHEAAGLWDALRAIARLAHAGCRAGTLRVTPFNGRLFAPARTPLAERRDLDDDAARKAVIALSTRPAPDRAGRERIAYRDLGVEQLGAVYETLLDYEPRASRTTVTLEAGSGVRKASGTFYTPQPIADYLVRRTLGPLVRDRTPEQLLQLRIVDPAMGSGAFLVAACRHLAAVYEVALVRSGGCHASDVGEAERVAIRRTIAERCLYGVDLNPMAVQLARLSLWLATLAADRPLSFLDHRLQVGDSLLGAWLANLRQPPKARRRQAESGLPLFGDDAIADALRTALPTRFSLETLPNDTLDQVREKERAFAALTDRGAVLSRWKRIANLWCAAWFAGRDETAPPSAFGSLSDAILTGRSALPSRTADRHLAAAEGAADGRRLFHWELEFPEVFFDRDGSPLGRAGFDAVIGNPPWEMIRADSGAVDARSQARLDMAPVLRFTRDAGIYTAQSDGHPNRYQLFVERAIALTRPGGRLGLVLPSGLATDHGSAPLRRRLLSTCDVDAIVGMNNHRGVFPIHRSVRFLLVTASRGSPTRNINCRLGVEDAAELESIGDEPADVSRWFPVRLSPALLERISGPELVIPHLNGPTDVAIVERAASLFPPLGDASGWSATFGRELNASDDRGALHAVRQGLPVVEGKHVEPFHVALDQARHSIGRADAHRLLRSDRHQHPRLAYRDVASATNRLTLIAAVLPAGCVSTHTVFCLRSPLPPRAQHFLCGLFNSFVVNYLVRLRVTTHVSTGTVERLPIPTADAAPAAFREIAALARLLSHGSNAAAFAMLNARVADLYQLTTEEFEHILGTFPLMPSSERHEALRLFTTDNWKPGK